MRADPARYFRHDLLYALSHPDPNAKSRPTFFSLLPPDLIELVRFGTDPSLLIVCSLYCFQQTLAGTDVDQNGQLLVASDGAQGCAL